MPDTRLHLAARLALAAAVLALAAPGWAQERTAEDDEIVVTAQKANQTQVIRGGQVGALGDKAAEDVPFSIRAYSAALILNQQPQTLGQVLENDPSVRTTYGFGNSAELFVVRGFPLFGDDIALDGLYGLTPRQLVSPELYEQVQVLNGASAFLNGAAPGGSGIGGGVNLSPKRAGDAPLTRITANLLGDSHVGGSFDVGRRFAGGAFGVRVNGAGRRGDVGIEDEFRSSYVLGSGVDWRSGRARLSLDLAYQRVKVRRGRPTVTVADTSIPRVPDADQNYAQAWTFTELREVFGVVRGEYDLTDTIEVFGSFGIRDGAEDGNYSSITVTDAATGDGSAFGFAVPRTDNNEAGQVGIRGRVATGPLSHEFNAGASAIRQVNRNAFDLQQSFATNIYATPQVPEPPSFFVGGNLDDPDPRSRSRLASFYLSDTLGAFDERVLLTLGLRRQNLGIKSFAYGTRAIEADYDESATTPVVGLVVKPAEGISLYANRIEGLAQGPIAPSSVVNLGEVFPPFKSTQYEVGGKLSLPRFSASLALYQTSQPSGLSRPQDPADPTGPLVFALDGRQRNRGIELSLDGEPVDGLRIIGGASINEAKLRATAGGVDDGNDALGVPDYLVNANAEWDLPFVPGATLTGRVVRTGEQAVNTANTLELPAWTRFDLGARFVAAVADKPLTLRLTVDNVANKRFWASAFGGYLLQGLPRTVKLSASIDL